MRDLDIRNILKATRLKRYYNDPQSRVIDELALCAGDARVDLAVINGSLHGFEIKSEQDTLVRLPAQLEIYSRVFDYLYICAGSRHIEKLPSVVPAWCGIIEATNNGTSPLLTLLRPSRKNEDTDTLSIVQLLWRDEVLSGLREFGITTGLSGKAKPYLWRLLADAAPSQQIARYVREALKARANWRSELQPSENDGYFPLSAKS